MNNELYSNKLSDKKIIAFDVDNTLSLSREKIDLEMANLLGQLLEIKKVAIITGGSFFDIERQILIGIGKDKTRNKNLILLPTNGGGLYIYDNAWQEIFSHKLTKEEKEKIIKALKEIDLENPEICNNQSYGQKIQDRESQITYAACGENAPQELKKVWDPHFTKRKILQKKLQEKLSDFEVKIGGTTSIDITPKGMDKAFAISKLLNYYKLNKEDILFFGDAVYEGGNDYPVFIFDVDTVRVTGPEETKERLIRLLNNK